MSETCDVNVLVYASNAGSQFYEPARALLRRFMTGPSVVYLLWPAVIGYLRIATSSAALGAPLSPAEAAANIGNMLSRPHVRTAGEAEGFWEVYRTVAADVTPRGNLVSDAHLVALMRQHGIATMWSYDRDFRKFAGIRVRVPA